MVRYARFLPLSLALAGIAALTWTPAPAQITTGTIAGKVTESSGEPLPGVLVSAQNQSTGIETAITSDARGEYALIGLPPADYVVQARMSGYGAPPAAVTVHLGQVTPVNFQMTPGGGLTEQVQVTAGPPLVNMAKSEIGTIVTQDQIAAYPLISRDYNDLALLVPGIKQAPGGQFDPTKKTELYKPFTSGGTAGRNVNISIDGADNNDNVVGFFVQGFPLDAVQEFEVVKDQYKAEYGRALGGVVNVITRSGTNDFGGSAFGLFRSESTRARTFGEELSGADKDDSDREQYGLSVGGPIIKNKLFYYAAYEKQDEVNPLALSNFLTSSAGTEPPGFPFAIAPVGTTVPQDFERELYSLRLDYVPAKDHLLWVRYSRDENEFLNDQGGALTDPSNQGDSTNEIWSAVASWQWRIRGSMINELKIHKNSFDNKITTKSPDELLTLAYDDFQLGRNGNTPQATFQDKFQIRDDFSWLSGRHAFKAGIEYFRNELDFTFDLEQNSTTFVFNQGVDPNGSMASGDANANGTDDGIEAIDDVFLNAPFLVPPTEYRQWGAYFQDDWDATGRLRLNLGLRVDVDQGVFKEADEGINKDFYECYAHPDDAHSCGLDPNTPNPSNPPRGFQDFENTFPDETLVNVGPRLGFVYRVGGGDKDVVRGSWGLFHDKLVDNLAVFMRWNLSSSRSPSLPALQGCDLATDPTCSMTQLRAGSTPIQGYAALPADYTLANFTDPNTGLRSWLVGIQSVQSQATFNDVVFMPSPDWKTPYTSAFSVGWGHAFSPRLGLDTNLIYRRGFRQPTNPGFAGGTSGRDAPFPVVVDPNTGIAQYPGFMLIISTEGKTEYIDLETSLRGHFSNFDFAFNLVLSEALGTQDNGGTFTTTGIADIFPNSNIRYTGGDIDSEWGRISGNQTVYALLHGAYRFRHGFQTAAQIVYGSRTTFHGFGRADLNGDGFDEDYPGTRGSGLGDDLFYINWRGSKVFNTGKGTALEVYLDIFNLLNNVNYGIYVISPPLQTIGGVTTANPDYGKPTGETITPPFTAQLGLRLTF